MTFFKLSRALLATGLIASWLTFGALAQSAVLDVSVEALRRPTSRISTTQRRTSSVPTSTRTSSILTSTRTSTATSTTSASSSMTTASTTSSAPTAAITRNVQQLTLDPNWNTAAPPTTRTFNWVVSEKTGAPDGFQRPMLVVNGQYPGPLIEANEGDIVVVNVKNDLANTTALHWHGMLQNGTAWSDGPNGVTQCPIPAGGSFTYRFNTTGHSGEGGTFWWHAHKSTTYADGLTGPLVVHSPKDPLKRGVDYDVDQILIVTDWFHEMSETVLSQLLSVTGYNGSTAAPSPNAALINGYGVYNCSFATSNQTCVQQAPQEIHVLPNTRYRFRVINTGTHAMFYVSVDGHTLDVIEADDTPVTGPKGVHRIRLHNAQRYSVILNTNVGSNGDAFYLRATIDTACFAWIAQGLDPTALAVIRYVSPGSTPSTQAPTSVDWSDSTATRCIDMNTADLVPRTPIDAPSDDSVKYRYAFDTTLTRTAAGLSRFFMNQTTFINHPYQALLMKAYRGQAINNSEILTAVIDEPVPADIIINNLSRQDHPYHLHALKFFVVGEGTGSLTVDAASQMTFNTTNPLRRDTLVVPANAWAVIRIVADIPGVWAFHCHIAWHQAAGLFGAVEVQRSAIPKMNIPNYAFDVCTQIPDGLDDGFVEAGRRRSDLPFVSLTGGKTNIAFEHKRDEFAPRRMIPNRRYHKGGMKH